MRKRHNDTLKYTANIIGASAIAYFAASYGLKAVFSIVIIFFNKNATMASPIGVPEWVMGCANITISQGALIVAILALRAFCIKGSAPKIDLYAPKNRGMWLFLPVFLGGGIVTNIINTVVADACKAFFAYTPQQGIMLPNGAFALFLYFIAMVLAPSVLEEIFVRGYMQGLLLKWGPWFSILTSSVLFTLLHADITQMFGIFLLSVLLGIAAYATKSLLPGIIMHFINNSVAFLLLLAQQRADSATLGAFSAYVIIMIIIAAVLCAGVIYKGRFYKGYEPIPHIKDPKNRQSRFERLLTSPCFITVMLTLAVRAVVRLF